MKKTLLIIFSLCCLSNLNAQDDFEINFVRESVKSLLDPETDSLFIDKAEIKIFEANSASSIEVKFYDFVNNDFNLSNSASNNLSSLTSNNCNLPLCFYKLNDNLIYVFLSTKTDLSSRQKVFIKVNGKAGKQTVTKEVEL
ncbi:MAG: hypothetical protein JNK50_01000 [Bacteroidia bacterium]|nr:hypothetical protein [Bacteroidia bacterium]